MSFKTVLAPLSGDGGDAVALRAALAVAQRSGGRVEAVALMADPRDTVAIAGREAAAVAMELLHDAEAELERRRKAAAQHVQEALRAGIPTERLAFREAVGQPERELVKAARFADLVVLGRAGDPTPTGILLAEAALLDGGRPVLLMPPVGDLPERPRIAVAWDGSTTSNRAVDAALPLLASASTVHLLVADGGMGADAAQMVRHLADRGVRAEAVVFEPRDRVGPELLARAAELDSDLLVMGGYGHSRLREMVLGGVTRHVLQHADLPVLLAH
ncbi:MAG TPA: universal stress protein [Alphaproteobacteria bacterium]|nr:universal stress protein [Alphaproteobacteria bacterium]